MFKKNFVVVIKSNGNSLREKNGMVFLPFGSNYEIYLKNLDSRRAIVSVEIDGENVLDGQRLVMNGNSNHTLQGFLKGRNKEYRFKFIEKNESLKNARAEKIQDGIIRVSFDFEVPVVSNITWTFPISGPYVRYSYYNDYYNTSNGTILGSNSCIVNCSSNQEGFTIPGNEVKVDYETTHVSNIEHGDVITFKLIGKMEKSAVVEPLTTRNKTKCKFCNTSQSTSHNYCCKCGANLEY
jgi:hypothetical protein